MAWEQYYKERSLSLEGYINNIPSWATVTDDPPKLLLT